MKNLNRDSGMTKCIKKYPEIYDHADKVQRQITSFIKYLQSTSNVLNAMNAKNKIILYLTARSLRSLDKGGQEIMFICPADTGAANTLNAKIGVGVKV